MPSEMFQVGNIVQLNWATVHSFNDLWQELALRLRGKPLRITRILYERRDDNTSKIIHVFVDWAYPEDREDLGPEVRLKDTHFGPQHFRRWKVDAKVEPSVSVLEARWNMINEELEK